MDASLFARLPGELRNNIYDLILLELNKQYPARIYRTVPPRAQDTRARELDSTFTLAQTCKGIAWDLLGRFYSGNTFKIVVQPFYRDQTGLVHVAAPRKVWVGELARFLSAQCVSGLRSVALVVEGRLSSHALECWPRSWGWSQQDVERVWQLLGERVQADLQFTAGVRKMPDLGYRVREAAGTLVNLPVGEWARLKAAVGEQGAPFDEIEQAREDWAYVGRFFGFALTTSGKEAPNSG